MSITTNEPYSVVVSLTSWRGRIYSEIVQLVLFSLLKQKTKYRYKVVLVLSTDEFPKKEAELPANIVKLAEKVENVELLWDSGNSKAYKKYFPVQRKYPDIPIITIDDDSPAHEDFVEKMMELHNKDTKRVIYGYHMVPHNFGGIDCVRYGVALYPPKSLFPLDEHFGRKFFKDMDDEYMRLLHVLAGTQYFEIKASDVLCIQAGAQDVAMQRIMANQWGEIRGMWETLFAAIPELKKLWDKNVVNRN